MLFIYLDSNLDEASSLGGGGGGGGGGVDPENSERMIRTLARYIATNLFCSLPHLLLATCSTPPSP